ncbi:MAG: hypothetical protein LBG65_07760 [Puniceicoccales bacterium]|jgi:hypothetical protein|nr:hypothetical protein [Puniceicoccales bacterium]
MLAFLHKLQITTLLLLAGISILPPAKAEDYITCGMPTRLPESPFEDSKNHRFKLWASWGKIKVSPKTTLQIPVGFTPIPNYQNSRLLGTGWAFPMLESTLLAINDKEYELRFPTGHRIRLKKTRIPGRLEGSGWKASLSGKNATVQSSCGWTLIFEGGKLKKFKSPDGALAEFHYDSADSLRVTINGKPALNWKNEFDPVTTRRVAHLTLQDGRHALLRFGYRPVIVETLEKTPSGPPRKIQQTTRVETLASFQWDGEKETPIVFKPDELTITVLKPDEEILATETFRWDNTRATLLQRNEKKFEFPIIKGIPCLKTSYPDGSYELYGHKNDHRIQKNRNDPILLTEYGRDKQHNSHPRKISRIEANGSETLVQRFWYDENWKKNRTLTRTDNGRGIIHEEGEKYELSKEEGSGKLLWRKEFDEKGRLVKLVANGSNYTFTYAKDDGPVTIRRETNGEIIEKEIPLQQFRFLTNSR